MEVGARPQTVVKKPGGTEDDMQTKAKQAEADKESGRKLPDRLYALAYHRGSTVRYVMAFASDDEALTAAEISEKAREVAAMDGEYSVEEISVKW
jgi:predicted aconitase with swiveling domain